MVGNYHQICVLSRSWPADLRQVFYTALRLLSGADWLHVVLQRSSCPKHALLWVESLGEFRCNGWLAREPIAAAETHLMTARGNQPLHINGRFFTCSHRAALALVSEFEHVLWDAFTDARSRNVFFLSSPADDNLGNREAWQESTVQDAERFGVLDNNRQAGPHWKEVSGRYRGLPDDHKWDCGTSEQLSTFMLAEANAAAACWPTSRDQYVGVAQVAAYLMCNPKVLLRRINADPQAPRPDIEGGGGRSHQWKWSRLRLWVENKFSRQLPERFPSQYPV